MTGFTNREILELAMRQSAIDANCDAADFLRDQPVAVVSQANPNARKYLELPFTCSLISYGNNVVASVSEECRKLALDYISRFPAEHCFETPNLHVLNDALEQKNLRVCFMAEYFLLPEDFGELYRPEWSNALCEKRKELDVLGVGAYDGDTLIGFAACSADCASMWQIGVDVLPEYRRQGIASALTSRLAAEILKVGKVPFYCAAWSNVRSVRNAIKSGFRPAWVDLAAKNRDYVDNMNRAGLA